VEVVSDQQRRPPGGGWAAFYADHGATLLRVAGRIVGKEAFLGVSADDIVSETMRKLLAAGIPVGANARAYAITAVKNTALDLAKQKEQYTDADVDMDTRIGIEDIEEAVDEALLAEDIREALAELPEREAHAIREKVMNDRHWNDVAPELEVTTVQGVGKIVTRGFDKLRKMPRFAGLRQDVSRPQRPSTTAGSSPGTTP
jgi:RNA polymerase sigma factor (sigma-70 family)